MKRSLLLVFACAVFLTLGIVYLQPSKAQISFETVLAEDLELASDIRKITNRSPEGLVLETQPDGAFSVKFQERFQNVVLAKSDPAEGRSTGCVTSLDEANAFFGRDLETGEIYPRVKKKSEQAIPRGMSGAEFEFYTKLIEDARKRRLENPNAATLTVINNDGVGEGFNDPAPRTPEGGNTGTTLGQQRLNLFNFAAQIWGAYLDSSVTTNIRSQFNPQTCTQTSATLGSAGALNAHFNFANAEFPNTFYHAALANKIAGSDLSPADPEITATFNSSIDNGCFAGAMRWYYGFDSAGPGNAEDLLLTVLHELGHGLGFSSFVNSGTGAFPNGIPDIYARNMFDRTTGLYWNQMTNAQRQASALNSGNVFWDGANVKIASGFLNTGRETATGRVQLYTPTTLESGSSVSHYGTNTFPNLLMEPFSAPGITQSLDLTRQQMRDIGWYADSGADLVPDIIMNVMPSGTALTPGSTATITWANGGGFNRNISIDLSTDGGNTFPVTIASNIVNSGSRSFTVPSIATSQGRIRVRENDFVQPSGISAANLIIGAGGPTPTPTPAPTPTPIPGPTVTVPYSGPVVLIPDNSAAGTNLVISVSGVGTISDLDFRFGGTVSSADPLSTTVGVNHSWIGDLVFRLTSPAGTSVTFFDRPGVPATGSGCSGNNLFNLTLNDDGGLPAVESQCPAGGDNDGPLTGNFSPNNPFAAFDGQNANGNWTLNVSDNAGQDIGFARAFSLVFTGIAAATPTPTPTATPTPPIGTLRTAFDYDGDRRADISIYRPSIGDWYHQQSRDGLLGIRFGLATDRIVPADFDGDGKTDVAVYRPSDGTWYIVRSTDGTFMFAVFGLANDLPVPGDFDGDGRADISVFRPSDSTWYRLNSSNGSFFGRQFGAPGDKPVMGDFDGDGRADLAVFRPSAGAWFQIRSQTVAFFGEQFGTGTDVVVPADYDGDRRTDLGVYRASNGFWYVKLSSTGAFSQTAFGAANDIPAPADYDGDGRADICVFRPSEGQWYRLNSSNGMFNAFPFGTNGDRPTQSAFQ